MTGPATITSAGDDADLRRWRVTVTVGAWLLIAQSGLGAISALLSIPLAATFRPESLMPQLGPLGAGIDLAPVDRLFSQLRTLNYIQLAVNGAKLAAAAGLLKRQQWGWFATVVIHLLETAGVFIFGLPALRPLVALADPAQAGQLSLVITILIALIPASIVAILLLKPVTRQFERN
jgi:hypothetical protein